MKKFIKRFNCMCLAIVVFAVSLVVGGNYKIMAQDGSHTHSYINQIYLSDAASGHIKTCTICGETSGDVAAHTLPSESTSGGLKTLKCTSCGYRFIYTAQNEDNPYFKEAINGELLSNGRYAEKYVPNLSGTGMTEIKPTDTGNPFGLNAYIQGKDDGVFAQFADLAGSGTHDDPYIINDALTLYKVLASGGTNYKAQLYFKLGCDINLDSKQWVDIAERWIGNYYVAYKYLAWNGVLDGDGHIITGLYSNADDLGAGFVPAIGSNGVIKNLHFDSANVKNSSGAAGVVAGIAMSGAQIINCSAENSGETALVGKIYGTIQNSYVITASGSSTYYNAAGSAVTADQIDISQNSDIWYKGMGGTPRLLNRAKAETFADINGDGISADYSAADIVALKNHLMWVDGYENIYGDIDRNGITDITDLAILQRDMAGDYNQIIDGFWRNIELNKFGIYYTDNDNLDFARKLELYFKNNIGVSVAKQKATAPTQYAIVLKKDSTLNTDYTIVYDKANAVLTFTGKSFTAVEQAVLDFISKSDYNTSTVYQTSSGTLSTEKQSVTINGKQYYYAWGDEFSEGSVSNGNTTVNYGKWDVRDMGSDPTVGDGNNSTFRNLKFVDENGLAELNVVQNGKLTMHRGVGYGAAHVGENTGNLSGTGKPTTFDSNDIATSGVLYTRQSMLFKRGYLEMQCTLPSDGYSFPAWWLMFNAGNNNAEVSRSLYSKVYEKNEDYNYALYYTPDDYKTYKYKLPGATYEVDIFEIIQYPNVSGKYNWSSGYTYTAQPNKNHKLQYTIHKWYTHSKTVRGNNLPLKVYELDWASDYKTNGFTQILDATHNGTKYVQNWGSLICHTNNLADGAVNANISTNGNKTSKYSRTNLDETYTVDGNNQVNAKIGLLWDETQISQYVWFEGSTTPIINKIDIADLNYDNANFDPEQYAYMLMENHLFTHNGGSNLPTSLTDFADCTMVIDYVRLYQLDGQRDIVTPETEAFNNPVNRFN